MKIGILALQGAFLEHEQRLEQLGADCFEIRQLKDLEQGLDGLVLPGGESTVQRKLLQDLGLFQPLKEKIENGLPVMATCAGLILLAKEIDSGEDSCSAEALHRPEATIRSEAPHRAEASIRSEAPLRAEASIRSEAPLRAEASIRSEAPLRAEATISANAPLCAEESHHPEAPCFGTIPMTAKRNAYGRQLGSFHTVAEVQGLGPVPMTFIRAPHIASVDKSVQVLATVQDHIVGVRYGNQIALAFHPELDSDPRLHAYFLDLVAQHLSL